MVSGDLITTKAEKIMGRAHIVVIPKTRIESIDALSSDGHRRKIVTLCRHYGVQRLALFGSILRADFDPSRSDIDVLVEFARYGGDSPARQYFDFKAALEKLFGWPVDLVELSAMPDSRLRRIIERTQVPVYAEAA